ncbi:MAG: hypothetical protein LH614_19570 [Pyrinomonadaceae bacterium]|nr:hypothetical protein [Pyrinomonadaceae bacterium]
MIKVIEKTKKETGERFDSLIVEIPKDFALSHGLPEKSLATLTLQNGKMVSEIISYTEADEAEIGDFIARFPEFDAEMKKLGD